MRAKNGQIRTNSRSWRPSTAIEGSGHIWSICPQADGAVKRAVERGFVKTRPLVTRPLDGPIRCHLRPPQVSRPPSTRITSEDTSRGGSCCPAGSSPCPRTQIRPRGPTSSACHAICPGTHHGICEGCQKRVPPSMRYVTLANEARPGVAQMLPKSCPNVARMSFRCHSTNAPKLLQESRCNRPNLAGLSKCGGNVGQV